MSRHILCNLSVIFWITTQFGLSISKESGTRLISMCRLPKIVVALSYVTLQMRPLRYSASGKVNNTG